MKMTAILNDKFGDEIDSEIRRDTEYIKATDLSIKKSPKKKPNS